MRSSASNLLIHSRVWPCPAGNRDYSCTCGVAIQEGFDLVVVDMCQWQDKDKRRVRALPVRIKKRSQGTLGNTMKVLANEGRTSYKVCAQ